MNTKKLMTKVTLGAAMILTTATVATTVVVPNVVRADDLTPEDHVRIAQSQNSPDATSKYMNDHPEIFGQVETLDYETNAYRIEGTSAWKFNDDGTYYRVKGGTSDTPSAPVTTPSTTEPTTPSTTDNTQTSGSSATSTESSEASSTEGTGTTGTTSSTTEASQTSVADKGQASTTGAKQDNTTTSSQETKSETSNSSAPVATPTAVNGSKTASSATPAKTNQLPVTGESNLISTIMGITGLTLLLSWFGFKAYRESK